MTEIEQSKLGELQGALEGLQHKNKGGIKRLWHKVISVEEDKGKIEGYTRKLNGCFQDLKVSVFGTFRIRLTLLGIDDILHSESN